MPKPGGFGDALRMRFPGYGMFTGKVVGFEGNKGDVHWNAAGSSSSGSST